VREVRKALIYMESEQRRRRQWEREDKVAADEVEAVIAMGPSHPDYNRIITERLVDLLWDGRCEDFDKLAAMCPDDIVRRAGDCFTEQSTPAFDPVCTIELRGPKHLQP